MLSKANKFATAVAVVLLLSGCGSKAKPPAVVPVESSSPSASTSSTSSTAFTIPTNCTKTGMLKALNIIVPNSLYIDTKWSPAAGTELADFLDNGGLACSYGIQSAEIGITTKWVSDSQGLFEKRISQWMSSGFEKIDIPNMDETEAYFLLKKQSPTQEFHIWEVNMKYHGAWIKLNCTAFAQDLATGYPLLKAATI